ncbi:hypothetical protein SAMN05192566_2068 [Methylophilus rhizosphaerae]|uniref:Uncharacterized protein n=2 Tax=Methylophilus rhizosphaerae TaxID=492660 RepID=A0A1G9DYU0_9PROT|nr:hypothetical protein SAMN05192566_2068 [Methylophilus rhizosphaerae]
MKWLMATRTNHLPNYLRALAETYAKEHHLFREKDARLDPGYLSLHQLADHLPASATYQQAVQASAHDAAQRV